MDRVLTRMSDVRKSSDAGRSGDRSWCGSGGLVGRRGRSGALPFESSAASLALPALRDASLFLLNRFIGAYASDRARRVVGNPLSV